VEVRQLRYFLAVLDHGTMQEAARALFIAQPSLSQAIAGLERELGIPLFRRVGRRLVITSAGQEFATAARIAVRNVEAAKAVATDLQGLESGLLELVAMPTPGIEPLTTLLKRFHQCAPRVRLDIRAAFTPEEVLADVRSGEVEMGILGGPTPLVLSDLDVVALDRQELLFIIKAADDADGPQNAEVTAEQLADIGLIVPHRGTLMRTLVDSIVANGKGAHIVAELDHRTSILPMVLAGIGGTVLPEAWAPQAVQAGAVVKRIVPPVTLHNFLVTGKLPLTPAAATFRSVATQFGGNS
jgi:DNA-binding transcriptional LysR family regulator